MEKTSTFRVNKLVQAKYPTLSQAQIEEALDSELVLAANGKKLQKGLRVLKDDFDYSKLDAHLAKLSSGNSSLQITIVDETPNEWIIDKPAGTPGHPNHLKDFDTVTHWALVQSPEIRKEFPEIQPTLTPHRLDTGTSGLLVVCKTKSAFENWRAIFSEKKLGKKYWAWCWNDSGQDFKVGEIINVEKGIAHHPSDSRKMILATEHHKPPFLHAQTDFKVLKVEGNKVLLDAETHSGVMHQIRIHALSIGLPLVGDRLYDDNYDTRTEKPTHHSLRAYYIKADNRVWELKD